MKPPLARIEYTVPPTLEKRMEAMEALRTLLAGLPAELKKYNPDEPRVPAGNPDGGEWTTESGHESPSGSTDETDAIEDSTANPVEYAAIETGTRTDATEATAANLQPADRSAEPPIKLASDWRNIPVNLAEEESPNGIGHTIGDHVGKSFDDLVEALQRKSYYGPIVDVVDGAEGSFDSLENANDLVNRTLRANSEDVDLVASGEVDDDFIAYRFGFVTGYEAYRPDPSTEPYERPTYAVGVYIWHDEHSPRGFRVRTAYPMNQ